MLAEPWAALVPMPDGTDATIRSWELRGLLDRLEAICNTSDAAVHPGSASC
jgi:hypothetical protein